MRIDVRHIDAEHVEITLTPNWVARLFGARARRGIAVQRRHHTWHRGTYQPPAWWWKATEVHVGTRIEEHIECVPIGELPRAALSSGGD